MPSQTEYLRHGSCRCWTPWRRRTGRACGSTGCPRSTSWWLTVLSQNTSDVNTDRAFAGLRSRFAGWDDVAAAPTAEVVDAIRVGGLANQKGPRIQAVLRELAARPEGYALEGLARLPVDEAMERLTSLPGVGKKTASCVLLFSLDMPVMPVDTHVLRVSRRLG